MSGGSVWVFVIVGSSDNPIYEAEIVSNREQDTSHLHEFILHASLDVVEELEWTTQTMRLHGEKGAVDRFNTHSIAAFITAGRTRFLMLYESKHDDHPGITKFFNEVYDLYLKAILNPFYQPNTEIQSAAFNQRVHHAMKKCLPIA
eukprot:TRINITY_DN14391_c0_g1_i3.p2 TRINITY_DN14391_c0_g1~~TRINITY_DN14391_c0_g1_i3.p2  ORF type:complete len:146 (+),score=18.73 TRINITY_DN14391_c0_g1_i3:64-501(+)